MTSPQAERRQSMEENSRLRRALLGRNPFGFYSFKLRLQPARVLSPQAKKRVRVYSKRPGSPGRTSMLY
jgi:hypothetical protein